MPTIKFSVISSDHVLSKSFHLGPDGELLQDQGGQMTEGFVEVRQVTSLAEFAQEITNATPHHAFCYGIPLLQPGERKRIVTTSQLPFETGAIARTNTFFGWHLGPSIGMIDHDSSPDGRCYSCDELVEIFDEAVPELAYTEILWVPSSGSCIYNAETGTELRGIRGQRFYFSIDDGHEIERVTDTLFKKLWMAGYGWIKIGKSGACLTRTLIDDSVYQPCRLDFVGGAYCKPPLIQRRGNPVLIPARKQ